MSVRRKDWFGREGWEVFAEYVARLEGELAPKPANVSFEDAAG